MRAGLTRSDPSLLVLLLPWQIWLGLMLAMWTVVGVILRPTLRWLALVIALCVQLWLAYAEDLRHLYVAAFLVLVFLTYGLLRAWARRRALIGDAILAHHDLAQDYAAILLRSFTDDFSRDRAIRLQHSQPHRRTDTAGPP